MKNLLFIILSAFSINASANQLPLPVESQIFLNETFQVASLEAFISEKNLTPENLQCAEESWNQGSDAAVQWSRSTGTPLSDQALYELTNFFYENCINGVHGVMIVFNGHFFFVES
jgi:hypothetical protein